MSAILYKPCRAASRVRAARAWALMVAALTPLAAAAHDFWIQPDQFFLAGAADSAATLMLRLDVGHGPERQQSAIAAARIKRFDRLTPDGQVLDIRASVRPEQGAGPQPLPAGQPGMHLLVLESDDQARSYLPAGRFNAYLRDEGLALALSHRIAQRRMDDDGAERYSRVAKALIEVGTPGAGEQRQSTAVLGLPLELVLERSPSLASPDAVLPVRVWYEGRPLAGALVKLTNLAHDAAPVEVRLTGVDGRVNFTMPRRGSCLMTVTWTKPVQRGDGIDFDTVFSSLSFGVPQ